MRYQAWGPWEDTDQTRSLATEEPSWDELRAMIRLLCGHDDKASDE